MLALLFLVANFYTVRRIARSGVELYLYDKLLVAYQVGGMAGLKDELERVLSEDKMRHELEVAKKFKQGLGNQAEPSKFLADISRQKKNEIDLLRNMRNTAFALIILLLLARLIVNRLY